jgi:Glycosyltransferase family 17
MFPLSVEVDLLHVKLMLLGDHVDLFWFGESVYSTRGKRKPLHFNESKDEPRFAAFKHLIRYEIDTFKVPGEDKEIGWEGLHRARNFLGERFIEHVDPTLDAVVIFTDADEVPSVEAVEWLRQNCCERRVTYEFFSTMPHYLYNFGWLSSERGYAIATARNLRDELEFRRVAPSRAVFEQEVRALGVYPSGFHCGFCMSSEYCVLKMEYVNTVDGPPYLGDRVWSVGEFDMLRRCGINPHGEFIQRYNTTLELEEVWSEYEYLRPSASAADSDLCAPVSVTLDV